MAAKPRNNPILTRDNAATIQDRENIAIKAKKNHQTLEPIRRPALNDLGNKLINQATLNPKKPVQLEPIKKPKEVAYSSKQLETADVDTDVRSDPQLVSEYAVDIFKYLKELEVKYEIREGFLDRNHKTTSQMRTILVNWLVQVHENFKMLLETLHLCINIVDRYLQDSRNVGKETLQLVGTSALLIASKYEEIFLPDLSDFVFICDNAFSKRQILQMEMRILNKLECSLGRPVTIHFLRRYSKIMQVKCDCYNLSKYILELALIDSKLSHFRPSLQAAAACCLSMAILNNNYNPAKDWSATMVLYTDYKYSDIRGLLHSFAHLLVKAETMKNQTIRTKYANSTFGKISTHSNLKGRIVKKLAEAHVVK